MLSLTLNKTPQPAKSSLWDYNYTSGMLSSARTFYQQYGYFEMRAKLPVADGMWSAFWLLPKDQTAVLELDVFENIGDNRVYATEHHVSSTGAKVVTNVGHVVDDIAQFHTYGLLWTAKELVWYVDGVMVYTRPTSPDLDRPMYIVANLALGGAWSGARDPALTTASMQIDYIRAYDVDPYATRLTVNDGVTAPAHDTYLGDEANNILEASSGADLIQGLGGADKVDGGLGDDTLQGGEGVDTLRYAYSPRGVQVSLAITGPQDTSGAGIDTVSEFENLAGSNKADRLTGSEGANTIDGRDGDDIVEGGLGKDVLWGGPGWDTASYAGSAAGVTLDLSILVSQNTGGAGLDKLGQFEALLGSSHDDLLAGDAGDNLLEGGAGDDQLDGRGGADTVAYSAAASGVVVDLGVAGSQNTFGAGADTLIAIEQVTGSAFGDLLRGDGLANRLDGRRGDDTLHGGDGDDTLLGGGDNDSVFGDGGVDTLVFSGTLAQYSVSRTTTGFKFIDLRGDAPDGVVLTENVEKVAFLDGLVDTDDLLGTRGVTIIGTSGADAISLKSSVAGQPRPTALRDAIYGLEGNDKLNGGAGADLLAGGGGERQLHRRDAG